MDREKVIKGLEYCIKSEDCRGCIYWEEIGLHEGCALNSDVLAMLKEQKQIKSPDEFKSLLLGMFDSIWDVEIDHPVFQDTVGELMEGVLQAYRQAVKWE